MFSKQDLQVIEQTLTQRRNWLLKAIKNPELGSAKLEHEKTLQQLEAVLSKVAAGIAGGGALPPSEPMATANHYISTRSTSSIRELALKRRLELQPNQIRVLLVDDDQFICDLLRAFLEAANMVVVDEARDGMIAVNMLYEANPVYDLVLCDWNMPNKSGLGVHEAMRAAERYYGTVFMLVTGVTEAKQIRAAIEDGVDDYVVKPIEQEKLLKKIARFFPKVVPT